MNELDTKLIEALREFFQNEAEQQDIDFDDFNHEIDGRIETWAEMYLAEYVKMNVDSIIEERVTDQLNYMLSQVTININAEAELEY